MIPLFTLKQQIEEHKSEISNAIRRVVENGQFIQGKFVNDFENTIANYLGVHHAISCASGTQALVIALLACGVDEGDEVITTPYTFYATALAIKRIGATPVYCDINANTYNIDTKKIEELITPKTRAILPVHIFGQCCDMDKIMSIARKHKLKVIEDACQSIGARYKGRFAGTIGNAGVYSFYPTKNLGGVGDGGLVVTNNEAIASNARKLCNYGKNESDENVFDTLGYNSRLDALNAEVLRVKLKHLNEWNLKRRMLAHEYTRLLGEVKGVNAPFECKQGTHVYHQYVITSKHAMKIHEGLLNYGIGSMPRYPIPLNKQKPVKGKGRFRVCERVCKTNLALPMYPEMTLKDVEEVVNAIKEVI